MKETPDVHDKMDDLSWAAAAACTLPTSARPLRVAEFDQLFAEALERVDSRDGQHTRARLVLTGGGELAQRVQDLADKESSCCSFFAFEVTVLSETDGVTRLALDVEVPSAHADVLAGLVDRATAVADLRDAS